MMITAAVEFISTIFLLASCSLAFVIDKKSLIPNNDEDDTNAMMSIVIGSAVTNGTTELRQSINVIHTTL